MGYCADVLEDEGEFLHRRDDDFLAALDELAQVAGALSMADRRPNLGELPDRRVDLPVQDAPVGDDDDRVEDGFAVTLQLDQAMGKPSDRVRLAATG